MLTHCSPSCFGLIITFLSSSSDKSRANTNGFICTFVAVTLPSFIHRLTVKGWSSYAKVDTFVLLPMQSIALASTTFVGQNLGAKQIERTKKGTKVSLGISLSVTLTLSVLLNLVGKYVLAIFTSDLEVIKYGLLFMKVFSPFYFVMCFTQIYAGALRGAGDSKVPMVIMLSSFVVFRQLSLYIGTKFFNTISYVAFTYPMGWVLGASLMTIYYHQGKWLKKLKTM